MHLGRLARRTPTARQAALRLRFGDPGRVPPLTSWGSERGLPVDRWYVERFLAAEAGRVRGRVLEVKSDAYARRFGGDRVEAVDVLDIDPGNPRATVVGDLCAPGTLRPGHYDAAVVTQTLQLVADPPAALRHVLAALRPGGSLLLTAPSLSRVVDASDRWRWTAAGMADLLHAAAQGSEVQDVQVAAPGNCLAARAFLFGLAVQDLEEASLAAPDDRYPLVVTARVTLRG